jgi:hypothetical protein
MQNDVQIKYKVGYDYPFMGILRRLLTGRARTGKQNDGGTLQSAGGRSADKSDC